MIAATNIFFGQNIFQNNGTFNDTFNWDLTGFATVKVRATNVVDSGLITVDSTTGLIDITGKELNFDSARFELTGGGGVNVIDWGGGGFGTNSSGWSPAARAARPTLPVLRCSRTTQGLPSRRSRS